MKNKSYKFLTDSAGILKSFEKIIPKGLTHEDILFFCVGTDRSTGDSLGPIIGSKLNSLGYDVFGTIHNPVHAVNIEEKIKQIPEDKYVIAIDAGLGRLQSVGTFSVCNTPLRAGAGVKKELPPVGDMTVMGIVNISGYMEYFVLNNTRLSVVFDLSDLVIEAIKTKFPINLAIKEVSASKA